jgi:predicted kinase
MKWIKDKVIKGEHISLREVVEKESHNFDLLNKLEGTEQDPEWHSEGNVFIHTQMVIDETIKLFSDFILSDDEKYFLVMAAIFHDIAKPITTKRREINGVERVVAPKHEYFGMSYLFYRFDNKMTENERTHILNLIGYHQVPKLLVIKNKNEWHYRQLTRNTNGKLFYIHQLADMKGRTCKDKELQLLYLEEFKMFCEEYNCFNTKSNMYRILKEKIIEVSEQELNNSELLYLSRKTLEDLINNEYSDPSVGVFKHFTHKSSYSRAFVMCGLSGSGKSTLSNQLQKLFSITRVISLDEIRKKYKINNTNRKSVDGSVLQEATKLFKEALAAKEDVIWDACNLRRDFRDKITKLISDYNGISVLAFVANSVETSIKNDSKREKCSFIGEDVIKDQVKSFQYPERNEFNDNFTSIKEGF